MFDFLFKRKSKRVYDECQVCGYLNDINLNPPGVSCVMCEIRGLKKDLIEDELRHIKEMKSLIGDIRRERRKTD